MRLPTPGTAIACVALALSLTGGAYAAVKLPSNSVTTRQVRDRSLTARDFKRGQLPRGARGPQGVPGPQGQPGPQGLQGTPGSSSLGQLTEVLGPKMTLGADTGAGGDTATSKASCPGTQKVVSGGYYLNVGRGSVTTMTAADNQTAWLVVGNNDSASSGTVQAIAYCAAG